MIRMLMFVSILLLPPTVYASNESPYRGQQQRDIKSLSQSDIDGYLTGKGMGFAKAAELNHYPGPRHVLDLSEQLNLSGKQLGLTERLFDKMQTKAIELGEQLVNLEKMLDKLFAHGSVSEESLDTVLRKIGQTRAKLRYVHLSAHLEQKQILNKHQIMLYDNIRGYNSNEAASHKHGAQHNH